MKITGKILLEMGFKKRKYEDGQEFFLFDAWACDDPHVKLSITVTRVDAQIKNKKVSEYYINTIRFGKLYSIRVNSVSDLFKQMVVEGIVAGHTQKENHVKAALGFCSKKIQE